MSIPVSEAIQRSVCRLCEKPIKIKGIGNGVSIEDFEYLIVNSPNGEKKYKIILDWGKEFAHARCKRKEMDEELEREGIGERSKGMLQRVEPTKEDIEQFEATMDQSSHPRLPTESHSRFLEDEPMVEPTRTDTIPHKYPPLSEFTSDQLIQEIIARIGDNPNREGLQETPVRVQRAWAQIYGGYRVIDPSRLLKVFYDKNVDQMVVLKDIEFYSTCEHHMVPFFGKAHIGYIPSKGRIVGLSKLARVLDAFSRRLQVQERITSQVASILMSPPLSALGAACVIEARHLCICSRGIGKQHSAATTSAMLGVFMKPEVRAKFFSLVGGKL